MAGNRSAAEKIITTYVDKIVPGMGDTYREIFKVMSDKDFAVFMDDLKTQKKRLVVICPNFSKVKISVEKNLAIGRELGHNFFERLWIEGTGDDPSYLTPNPYMVMILPVRRASQMLTKKISVPKHNRIIDALTGQPTGESKGAKISYPELQVCAAMGLDNCMVELMKYRGGDLRGNTAFRSMVSKYGTANMETLSHYASGVESLKTLKTYLACAHLKSTL